MKTIINTVVVSVILVVLPTQLWAHDLKMAFFDLSQGTKGMTMTVSFDKDDLAKALTEINPSLSSGTALSVWEEEARKYLTAHFSMKFEGQPVRIVIDGFDYDENYVRMTLQLDSEQEKVKSIQIFSDCLIKDIKGQSNIVRLNLYGRTRTFRLNRKRTDIQIDY